MVLNLPLKRTFLTDPPLFLRAGSVVPALRLWISQNLKTGLIMTCNIWFHLIPVPENHRIRISVQFPSIS